VANGNYPRASHFYDIRELSVLPGSPEPGQKASWNAFSGNSGALF